MTIRCANATVRTATFYYHAAFLAEGRPFTRRKGKMRTDPTAALTLFCSLMIFIALFAAVQPPNFMVFVALRQNLSSFYYSISITFPRRVCVHL